MPLGLRGGAAERVGTGRRRELIGVGARGGRGRTAARPGGGSAGGGSAGAAGGRARGPRGGPPHGLGAGAGVPGAQGTGGWNTGRPAHRTAERRGLGVRRPALGARVAEGRNAGRPGRWSGGTQDDQGTVRAERRAARAPKVELRGLGVGRSAGRGPGGTERRNGGAFGAGRPGRREPVRLWRGTAGNQGA